MRPHLLFLITAAVCLIYLLKQYYTKAYYDDTFWIALMTLVVSLAAYYLTSKNKEKQDDLS